MTRLEHAQRISQDLDDGVGASFLPGEPIRLRFGHPYRDPARAPRQTDLPPHNYEPGPNPFAPPPVVCEWTGEPTRIEYDIRVCAENERGLAEALERVRRALRENADEWRAALDTDTP